MTTFDFDSAWAGDAEPDDRADEERREALRARVFNLHDLLHQDISGSEPLLGPLVRRGQRTIVGGWGGHGKTTMSMTMLRAITTGGQFLGWRGPEGGARGLIIDVEQGSRLAIRRVVESWAPGRWDEDLHPAEMVGEIGEEMYRTHYCVWPEGLRLNDPHSPDARIVDEIIGEHRPDVVLLDPAYKTFIGKNNEEEVIKELVAVMDRWRVEHEFALILPMHCRKQQAGGFSMHDLAGSYIWSAWAETIVGVRRKGRVGLELHFWKDREGDLPTEKWDLYYEKDNGLYVRDIERGVKLPLTMKIWRMLQDRRGEWFTRKQIEHEVDASDRAVAAAMREIENDYQDGKYPGLEIAPRGTRGAMHYRYVTPMDEVIERMRAEGLDPQEEL